MSVVDPLPAGAFTLTGKTQGPAVNMGRCRYAKSQMMFFHLDEIRDAAVKAGWATHEEYLRLEETHKALQAERDALVQKVMDLEKKAEDLTAAIGWKPKAPAKKPAAKSAASSG